MKNLISKIKRIITAFITATMSFSHKIFAIDTNLIDNVKPTSSAADYGVPFTNPIWRIWYIAKFFIIPITLLIGLIIYFKKSSSSKKKKILITIGITTISVIICFLIDFLIDFL